MSQDDTTRLPVLEADDKKTKVGNFFVSNYPPYSTWSVDHRDAGLAMFDTPAAPGTPLGLYVHIPFCRKRCHFCYFRVYTDKTRDEVSEYLDAVLEEAKRYAATERIAGRKQVRLLRRRDPELPLRETAHLPVRWAQGHPRLERGRRSRVRVRARHTEHEETRLS